MAVDDSTTVGNNRCDSVTVGIIVVVKMRSGFCEVTWLCILDTDTLSLALVSLLVIIILVFSEELFKSE